MSAHRILGSLANEECQLEWTCYGHRLMCSGLLTSTCADLHQERHDRRFAGGNGEVEEEHTGPGEFEEVLRLVLLNNNGHMVAETVESSKQAEYLCHDCEYLQWRVSIACLYHPQRLAIDSPTRRWPISAPSSLFC